MELVACKLAGTRRLIDLQPVIRGLCSGGITNRSEELFEIRRGSGYSHIAWAELVFRFFQNLLE